MPLSWPTTGSSPRMWGTDTSVRIAAAWRRFIPTHVGNGMTPATSACRPTVHPHACGERINGLIQGITGRGSSPRMWGTEALQHVDDVSSRFIPTHVGNGSSSSMPSRQIIGSSPRMWGTDALQERAGFLDRFIPTHVGNGPSTPSWLH